ncbi:YTHDC2 [Bugula neritina]|uniref:YTHDC2 n=1 Tax=Bugula neritina TaxID=10212 RepID=A0A7J7ITR9_BUGNE|nr:YTHDC2 [Bugula neritina]
MSSLHPGMLELSQANGLWATGQATASRINAALQECQALFLVFTVQGSSYFHGLASVSGLAPSNLLSAFGQSNLTTVYFVNWIKSTSIPFTHTQSLYNVLCDNQPISMSRDGQELEVSVGEELVKLWNAVAVSSRGG